MIGRRHNDNLSVSESVVSKSFIVFLVASEADVRR